MLLLRQRATDELSAERERLRVTLASIGDAVLTTDSNARITFANPVAEELTGWSQPEVLGQPLEAVFRIVGADGIVFVPHVRRRPGSAGKTLDVICKLSFACTE